MFTIKADSSTAFLLLLCNIYLCGFDAVFMFQERHECLAGRNPAIARRQVHVVIKVQPAGLDFFLDGRKNKLVIGNAPRKTNRIDMCLNSHVDRRASESLSNRDLECQCMARLVAWSGIP